MFPFKIGSTIVHSAKRLQQWIAYLEHEKLPSNSGQLGHQQAYLRVLIKDFWPLWPNEIIYTRISSIETSTTLMHPIQAYYYFINRYYKRVKNYYYFPKKWAQNTTESWNWSSLSFYLCLSSHVVIMTVAVSWINSLKIKWSVSEIFFIHVSNKIIISAYNTHISFTN
jgi:hypothetical protein